MTLFFDYWRQHRLQIKVLRIFNTYGPRLHPNDGRVASNFIVQALRAEDITIYGNGMQSRSFCFVDDLIEAMVRMMNIDDAIVGPVNVGNPVEFTMLEMAEKIIGITRSSSQIVFRPLPSGDPQQRRPDIDLATQVLGGRVPSVQIEQGLYKAVGYFRSLLEGSGSILHSRNTAT